MMKWTTLVVVLAVSSGCQVCRIACTNEQTFVLTDGAGNALQPARVEVAGESFDCGAASERVRCSGNRVTVETFESAASVKLTAQGGETWSGNVAASGGAQQVASCMCVNTFPDVTVQLSP